MKSYISLFVLLVFAGSIYSQQASAVWPLTNPANSGTGFSVVTSGSVSAADERFNNTEINQYTGFNNSQRIRMAGTNNTWPAGLTQPIDSVYVEFSVTPLTSYTLLVDSLSLKLSSASSSTFKAEIYYSKNSDFSDSIQVVYVTGNNNNYLSTGSQAIASAAPGITVNEGETFYLRVYPWHENAGVQTGKYLCLQDVAIYGTASANAVPASVTWPLSADELPVISGLLDAGAETFGNNLYLYDFSQVAGTGTNAARITTVSHDWQAETAPDFTRYVQYAVSPKTGGTFYTDSVSFKLGAIFSNNLRAAVYYSKDSTFAGKTALVADTSLVSSNLTSFSFGTIDTVETGEVFYLRIYPYNTNAEGWAKLVYVSDVKISGSTKGLAILLPTVSTSTVTYISTTFATSGGNITADGGGAIIDRGVCWNTTGFPVVTDSHTSDGSGTGMFTSVVTGLDSGVTYHLRAYATNISGTAYGNEEVFSTLPQLIVPELTTTAVTNIQVTTAISGGTVTGWGGSEITARGICWNTTGAPDLNNSHTIDGSGIGSFTSGITNLTAGTTYYVKAYATNSTGTGYGEEVTFTSAVPQVDTTVVVALDGSGNYTTVQAAFNDVPSGYTGKWTIFLKKGTYYEKVNLAAGKINVVLIGEDRDSTIITYDDFADRYGAGNPGTSGCYSVAIDANDFIAKNITFQNTYSPQPGVSGTQAVALRANGDRQEYINCRMLGFQDTYYTWGGSGTGRLYHKNCYIEGTVDFIFGRDIAVFDSCTIKILRDGGALTAASTDATSKFGYVFRKCTITSDSIGYNGTVIDNFYLGRPWQASPRTVFLNCYLPANLDPAGWLAWNVTPALYAEYGSYGPGASSSGRVNWSYQLNDSTVNSYSLDNIFAKRSAASNHIVYDWMPVNAMAEDNLLPVELVSFSAAVNGTNVVLKWQTASEKNNHGFEIQRKLKSSGAWVSAGFVEGRGTTQEPSDYTFSDKLISSGSYIYRLKQIDYDGTFSYSAETEADVAVPLRFELKQNYPNPFNPATTINYSIPVHNRVVIKIYDVLGEEVFTLLDEIKEPGFYQAVFNGSNLASGIYMYRITAGNFVQAKKMLLLK